MMLRYWLCCLVALAPMLQAAEPLLSSRFADIAYGSQDSFIQDLLRQRAPANINAPGARYRNPLVSEVQWHGKEGLVMTQQAWFLGQPYQLVVVILPSDNKPLYKSRRVLIECRLPGALSRSEAIQRCYQQQSRP
ncbi:hypothetical protein [Gallaecimonas xiamenensis]|nr:hypothetical protein [Gallaecimonas xiamenensis]